MCIVQTFSVLYLLSARKTWRITASTLPPNCQLFQSLQPTPDLPPPSALFSSIFSSSPISHHNINSLLVSHLFFFPDIFFYFILFLIYLFTYLSIPTIICLCLIPLNSSCHHTHCPLSFALLPPFGHHSCLFLFLSPLPFPTTFNPLSFTFVYPPPQTTPVP